MSDGPASLPHLAPGHVVDGKYRIVRMIGEGGMGTVFEARHEVLGNHVALKFLHPEIAQQPGLEQRFIQEAKLSATIDDVHIARVSDVDTTVDGAYLVMELLQGEPLQALMDREGRLGMERSVDFTLQVLDGLSAAHRRGVVHRDLKPDNVFVTPSHQGPLLKLLDFGIAKLRAEEGYQMTLTRPGAIMGTPEYMAPEQAYSADLVDQRSDLYAVGVMLFEMLSAQRPADGDSPQEIAEKTIKGEVRRLGEMCPHLPPVLVQIVHKAISANPDDRFSDAHAMRVALLPFSSAAAATQAAASRLTGTATPFRPVSKTPRVGDASLMPGSYAAPSSYAPESRLSAVPRTLPPDDGPPVAATQQRATPKTASMPEFAPQQPRVVHGAAPGAGSGYPAGMMSETTSARRRKGASAWLWLLGVLLLAGAAVAAWIVYDVYLEDTTPPPPQPTRRATLPAPVQAPPVVDEADDFDFDDLPAPQPGPRPSPRPGRPSPEPPSAAPPTLPTFQLPTNFPIPSALPTAFPTAFPTALPTELPPFLLPPPTATDQPKESAPTPNSPN